MTALPGQPGMLLVGDAAAPPPAQLLLDQYPGAAAAYSLRLLNSTYTGNCIEVRRASDNTPQNIGFLGGVVDTALLKNFCASTSCFVRTWYDQTTNAQHGQMVVNANQPSIVTNGVILRENGQPAISFTGSDVRLNVPNAVYLYGGTQFFIAAVVRANNFGGATAPTVFAAYTSAGYKSSLGYAINPVNSSTYDIGGRRNGSDIFLRATSTVNAPQVQRLVIGHNDYSQGKATLWENGVNTATNNGFHIGAMENASNSSAPDNIGGFSFIQDYNGQIQEIVIYNSNQTSNRTGIENNIRTYYNTY